MYRFLVERAGGVISTTALSLPVLLGAAALAVDVGDWYSTHRSNQTATDAAAIAGAYQRLKGKGSSITAAAMADAANNGVTISGSVTMTVNNPPATGNYVGETEAVEVIISMPQPKLLSGVLFGGDVVQKTRAVAAVQVQGTACILALDPTAASAVKIWGSTYVEAQNCVIGSNSNASNSIDVGGNAAVKTDSFWSVGDISIGSQASATLLRPALSEMWAISDPYSNLTIPTLGGCTATKLNVNKKQTLSPGVYCNGLSFGSQANVTLQPGVYYVNSGDFTVNGGATIACSCPSAGDGVTIVMTSDKGAGSIGTVTINGGANVTLNAPTSSGAAYPGVLIYEDRRANSNGVAKLNGGANMILNGAVYFPSQQIQFNGDNSASSNACTQIIGLTVEFTGNSKVYDDGCAKAGIQPIQIKGVRLVE